MTDNNMADVAASFQWLTTSGRLLDKASETYERAKHALNCAVASSLGLSVVSVVFGYGCPTSPINACVYDEEQDPFHDDCLFCHDPLGEKVTVLERATSIIADYIDDVTNSKFPRERVDRAAVQLLDVLGEHAIGVIDEIDITRLNESESMLRAYSAALDEIYALRRALAYESRVVAAQTLDISRLGKGRRQQLEASIERMATAARGDVARGYATVGRRNFDSAMDDIGGSNTLTRASWEAEVRSLIDD